MKLYAGIDLHSNNSYIGIIDENDNRIFKKRLPNEIGAILAVLAIYQKDIVGIVVESTYNWYWLVDGLQENGYKVHLANPAAISQYNGLKHSDDQSDSFFLAHLLRLNILPEGHIYESGKRPVRDLLRRRILFVQQRTAQILSCQSMLIRNLGLKMNSNKIKQLSGDDIDSLITDPDLAFTAKCHIDAIQSLARIIKSIEQRIETALKKETNYKLLTTVPGIGKILALTILLETGMVNRFPKVGNFSSYCRCVRSEKLSNGKTKGKNNAKNGNKYLSWAFMEAANFAIRFSPEAQRFYQRKKAKSGRIVALKALSNKLARAVYFIMRDQVPFDATLLYGH